MRRLSIVIVASVLLGGCATYGPSWPGGATGQAPSEPSEAGEQSAEHGGVGQTRPLERGHVETSGEESHREISRQPRHENAAPPPQSIKATASDAVMSLVDAADKAMNRLKPDRASALIERALSIAPRNPFLYQRLSAIRLVQGQPVQAVQLARKSNALAGRNPFVKQNNWALIAQARKIQGRQSAARQASYRVQRLKRISRQYPQ